MLLGLGSVEARRVAAEAERSGAPSLVAGSPKPATRVIGARPQQVTTATATPRLVVWTPTPDRAATERAGATATIRAGRTATVSAAGTIAAGTARAVRGTSEARGTVWPTAAATRAGPGDPGSGSGGTPRATAASPTPVVIDPGPVPGTTSGPGSGSTGDATGATPAATPLPGVGGTTPAGTDADAGGPRGTQSGSGDTGGGPGGIRRGGDGFVGANPSLAIIAGLPDAPPGGWPKRQAAPWIPPVDEGTINGMWAIYGSPWGDVPLLSRLVGDKPGPFGSLWLLVALAAAFLVVGTWLLRALGRRAGEAGDNS